MEETKKVDETCVICGQKADLAIPANWLAGEQPIIPIIHFCNECYEEIGETYAEQHDLMDEEQAMDRMADRRESRYEAYD